MNSNVLHFIDTFSSLSVLVIGEAILDSYLSGKTDRLCREAPVPIVSLQESKHAPGGAANTAVNVQSLGGNARFLSVIGDDPEGEQLKRVLIERRVNTEYILKEPGRQTLAKNRVLASSQMVVRFDKGSTNRIDSQTEEMLIERLRELYPSSDALIISDYGYGVLTPNVIETIRQLQAETPRILIADSKQLPKYREVGITAVKPNYSEAVRFLGLENLDDIGARVDQIASHGERILDLLGTQVAAVTLDMGGALIFERGCPPYRTYAKPAPNTRAAGAGDTFVSTLALAFAAGAYTSAAAELASAAASIVVSKEGTASCSTEELRSNYYAYEKHTTDIFGLTARVSAYHQSGKRIVFTNGCFDILHRGHITYLNKAKSLGDILIVGINSDDSVQRLKGPKRPINPLEDRTQVLAALSCIDLIVPFDGNTPIELIKVVQPDVFVKGGDYTRETLPEAPLVEKLGGEVVILPYLEDHSTTSIIERIQHAYSWYENGRVGSLDGRRHGG